MTRIAIVSVVLLAAFVSAIIGSSPDATWTEKLVWIGGMALLFGCLVAIGRDP